MRRQKYRSPRRPAGLYLQYLNRLIEENRWKGTPAKDVADEEYWNIWRRNKPEPRGRTRGESVVEIDAGRDYEKLIVSAQTRATAQHVGNTIN
jgi:hypothetical protein